MTLHKETPIKVNAWVDEGIAPLVAALNQIERVGTLGSCQEEPSGQLAPYPAYVLFVYRGNGGEVAQFSADFMAALDDSVPFCLQSDWRAGNPEPVLTISCPPDQVANLAAAVRTVVGRVDGSRGRALRS